MSFSLYRMILRLWVLELVCLGAVFPTYAHANNDVDYSKDIQPIAASCVNSLNTSNEAPYRSLVGSVFVLPPIESIDTKTKDFLDQVKKNSFSVQDQQKLLSEATANYLRQTLSNFLIVDRLFYGSTKLNLGSLAQEPLIQKTTNEVYTAWKERSLPSSLRNDDFRISNIKSFNSLVQILNNTCQQSNKSFKLLNKFYQNPKTLNISSMMGSDYSNSQRLEFEKLMGINATSVLKLGETQQKIRDKIKEIRTETYLRGGTLHRLALMTAMGTLLKTPTSLQSAVGEWSSSRCVEDGQQLKYLSLKTSLANKTIKNSVEKVRSKYWTTILMLLDNQARIDRKELSQNIRKEMYKSKLWGPINASRLDLQDNYHGEKEFKKNLQTLLQQYINENPYSLQQALIVNPSKSRAFAMCDTIRNMSHDSILKEEIIAALTPVTAIFTGGAAIVGRGIGGIYMALSSIVLNGYFFVSTVDDLFQSYNLEKRLLMADLSDQLDPQQAHDMLVNIRISRPFSKFNLLMSGLGVTAATAKIFQLSKINAQIKAYNDYSNAQGGSTAKAFAQSEENFLKSATQQPKTTVTPVATKSGKILSKKEIQDIKDFMIKQSGSSSKPKGTNLDEPNLRSQSSQGTKPQGGSDAPPSTKVPVNKPPRYQRERVKTSVRERQPTTSGGVNNSLTSTTVAESKPSISNVVSTSPTSKPVQNIGDKIKTNAQEPVMPPSLTPKTQVETQLQQISTGLSPFKQNETQWIRASSNNPWNPDTLDPEQWKELFSNSGKHTNDIVKTTSDLLEGKLLTPDQYFLLCYLAVNSPNVNTRLLAQDYISKNRISCSMAGSFVSDPPLKKHSFSHEEWNNISNALNAIQNHELIFGETLMTIIIYSKSEKTPKPIADKFNTWLNQMNQFLTVTLNIDIDFDEAFLKTLALHFYKDEKLMNTIYTIRKYNENSDPKKFLESEFISPTTIEKVLRLGKITGEKNYIDFYNLVGHDLNLFSDEEILNHPEIESLHLDDYDVWSKIIGIHPLITFFQDYIWILENYNDINAINSRFNIDLLPVELKTIQVLIEKPASERFYQNIYNAFLKPARWPSPEQINNIEFWQTLGNNPTAVHAILSNLIHQPNSDAAGNSSKITNQSRFDEIVQRILKDPKALKEFNDCFNGKNKDPITCKDKEIFQNLFHQNAKKYDTSPLALSLEVKLISDPLLIHKFVQQHETFTLPNRVFIAHRTSSTEQKARFGLDPTTQYITLQGDEDKVLVFSPKGFEVYDSRFDSIAESYEFNVRENDSEKHIFTEDDLLPKDELQKTIYHRDVELLDKKVKGEWEDVIHEALYNAQAGNLKLFNLLSYGIEKMLLIKEQDIRNKYFDMLIRSKGESTYSPIDKNAYETYVKLWNNLQKVFSQSDVSDLVDRLLNTKSFKTVDDKNIHFLKSTKENHLTIRQEILHNGTVLIFDYDLNIDDLRIRGNGEIWVKAKDKNIQGQRNPNSWEAQYNWVIFGFLDPKYSKTATSIFHDDKTNAELIDILIDILKTKTTANLDFTLKNIVQNIYIASDLGEVLEEGRTSNNEIGYLTPREYLEGYLRHDVLFSDSEIKKVFNFLDEKNLLPSISGKEKLANFVVEWNKALDNNPNDDETPDQMEFFLRNLALEKLSRLDIKTFHDLYLVIKNINEIQKNSPTTTIQTEILNRFQTYLISSPLANNEIKPLVQNYINVQGNGFYPEFQKSRDEAIQQFFKNKMKPTDVTMREKINMTLDDISTHDPVHRLSKNNGHGWKYLYTNIWDESEKNYPLDIERSREFISSTGKRKYWIQLTAFNPTVYLELDPEKFTLTEISDLPLLYANPTPEELAALNHFIFQEGKNKGLLRKKKLYESKPEQAEYKKLDALVRKYTHENKIHRRIFTVAYPDNFIDFTKSNYEDLFTGGTSAKDLKNGQSYQNKSWISGYQFLKPEDLKDFSDELPFGQKYEEVMIILETDQSFPVPYEETVAEENREYIIQPDQHWIVTDKLVVDRINFIFMKQIP